MNQPRTGKSARATGRTARGGKAPGRKTLEGILSVKAKGFGFVKADGGDEEVFIPLDSMLTAMDGDRVSAEIVREVPGRNPVGRIVKILAPGAGEIIGIVHRHGTGTRVVPVDERFGRPFEITADERAPRAVGKLPRDGDVVVVRRGTWVDPAGLPSGRIVEVLGKPGDAGMDLLIVARNSGLRIGFPDAVARETALLRAPDSTTELGRREDFRDTPCFTIDPESARDFDDAVSLVQLDSGRFELGVHIADVSFFVREGTALDAEAFERGTSVYFVNDVLPMLPERISNDLCSLKPEEDRFAFSVVMEIDSRGVVHGYRIRETIIRSRQRFTYREVEDIIQGGRHPLGRTIHQMVLLSRVLRAARQDLGSIDFDIPVAEISLDENGIPNAVRPSERLEANRLVEEFMLVANRTVARHMTRPGGNRKPRPFIYRVHAKPDEKSVRGFLDLLERQGLTYRAAGELESDDYRKILSLIENLEYKDLAEKVALRSMSRALYSTENLGHFGLAFDAYTHFTSPIRRYPDLAVHRLLKAYAAVDRRGRPAGTSSEAGALRRLDAICDQCSKREQRAARAEREFGKLKALEFLSGKVGMTCDGVIAGVASFGFFVELDHYLVEGLVHLSDLKDDRYDFDKDTYTLTGRKSGTTYRLGDPVRVTIRSVSKEEKRADFVLAKTDARRPSRRDPRSHR